MDLVLKVIAILVIVACISGAVPKKQGDKKIVVVLAAAAAVIFIMSYSFTIIPTGYTGVRITLGQIDDVTVQNGFNWKLPFIQTIEKVNNKQQDVVFENQVWSETSNRTAIYYSDITVTYQIGSEKSAWIYANVSDYKNTLVPESLIASAIKSSSKELNDEDATNRNIIEPLAMENIQKSLDGKYGEGVVYINKVIIGNADFEDSYNQAIAEKQQAQLAAEKQAIENQKEIDMAQAQYEVEVKNAQAEADAAVIKAEGEAKANEALERSLTEKILQQEYIEKWDGALPKVIAGEEASNIMFSIEGLAEDEATASESD